MRSHNSFKRAAACTAAILAVGVLAVTLSMHEHPHRAPGLPTHSTPKFIHHAASDKQGHIIGWVDHLVGPFTSIAANL